MTRLAHPIVYTPHAEHTHHNGKKGIAGQVTEVLEDGHANLVIFPPNLPPECVDDVPYGFGAFSYHLFQHEPEEEGETKTG